MPRSFITFGSSLIVAFLGVANVSAATCPAPSGSTITVNSPVTTLGCTVATGQSLIVNSPNGSIVGSPTGQGIVEVTGASGSVTNNGLIQEATGGSANGIYVGAFNSLTSITNGGTISTDSGQAAIYLGFSGNIGVTSGGITNTGTIANYSTNYQAISNVAGTIYSIVNSGVITASVEAIQNFGTIGTIQNTNQIISTDLDAIHNYNFGAPYVGTIDRVDNSAGAVISGASSGIANDGTITTINNYGSITGVVPNTSNGIVNISSISTINNFGSGVVSGGNSGIANASAGSITSIANSSGGVISGTGSSGVGIGNDGSIGTIYPGVTGGIDNSGTIQGVLRGISNTGLISTIANNAGGVISASSGDAIGNGTNSYAGTIGLFGNYGSITAPNGFFGINNSYNGTIAVLVNAQSNLTYKGNLPASYGIVLGSNAATYGRLAVTSAKPYDWNGTSGSGVTSFGISGGTVKAAKYVGVLSGVTASLLDSSSLRGTYGSNTYQLALESGSTTVWDLLFNYYIGPSTTDTQQSMLNTTKALQGTVTILNTALVNSLTYDCTEFGANNVCISVGGRNTAVSAANGLNNTSALLIAAYRPHPNYRIGAYADQNLSVNNAGSTVNLGNNTPLVGLFAAWTERLDGIGAEVRVSAAYGQKNATVTRQVVGTSEAGNGSAPINSQGTQVTAKYGFGLADAVIVSPYVGVRYTQNNMNGYSEQATSSVTAPLTYSALNTNATTALVGVGASYKFIPQATAFASAGIESDTSTSNGTYSATGVSGLTPINFNINPVKTRPTAMLGAYYDVEKNQRLGITGIYRQEPYQAVSTTTVMATYTVGL